MRHLSRVRLEETRPLLAALPSLDPPSSIPRCGQLPGTGSSQLPTQDIDQVHVTFGVASR